MFRSKKEKFTFCFATIITGGTVGIITGLSDYDSTVVAAVLSAILTGVIGGTGFLIWKIKDPYVLSVLSIVVSLFMISLISNMYLGSFFREIGAKRAAVERHFEDYNRRIITLYRCIESEKKINDKRRKNELPPLLPHQICPIILEDMSSPISAPPPT